MEYSCVLKFSATMKTFHLGFKNSSRHHFCTFLPGDFLEPYSNVAFDLSLMLEKCIGGQPIPTEGSKNKSKNQENRFLASALLFQSCLSQTCVPVPGSGRGKATSPPVLGRLNFDPFRLTVSSCPICKLYRFHKEASHVHILRPVWSKGNWPDTHAIFLKVWISDSLWVAKSHDLFQKNMSRPHHTLEFPGFAPPLNQRIPTFG